MCPTVSGRVRNRTPHVGATVPPATPPFHPQGTRCTSPSPVVPSRARTGPPRACTHARGRTPSHVHTHTRTYTHVRMSACPPVHARGGSMSQPYPRERPWTDVVPSEDVVYLFGGKVSQNQGKRAGKGCKGFEEDVISPLPTGGRGSGHVTARPRRSRWRRTRQAVSGRPRSLPGLPHDASVGVRHAVVSPGTA